MKIQLGKSALNIFKADGYAYSLFKGKHWMESKVVEYGIVLLHKYEVH